ncbi:MAG: YegS/Rv2252/BmrU family lipid kinase [Candidatus Eremiobacteraeota bacterium]|nr:YegS/Rv2252/BmrU family lipid kinase [Candidatus Eremiobacteraeota bacterium]
MRASLIVNSNSRLGRRHGPRVADALERRGVTLVRDGGAEAVDAIVAAGGDGTFARAIPLALERGVPMGLVPLGTFNDLARTLQIPLELEAACAVIADAHRRAIDVAEVNGVYYATEASIGLSSRLTRLQTSEGKQRFGWLAVALSAGAALRYLRPFHVEVSYDGAREHLKTLQLTVANSNHFGGFITVGDAAIDDGWLDLYAVEPKGLRGAAAVARALVRKKRFDAEGLRAYRSVRFQVTTARPHRITADGEPAGTTPACFQILPGALEVFAPAL